MANPLLVLSPTSGPAGTVVTVVTTRDVPQPAPKPVTVDLTMADGWSGSGTVSVSTGPEALSVVCTPAHTLADVSDDGTIKKQTFVVGSADTGTVTVKATTPGGSASATFTVNTTVPAGYTSYQSLAPKADINLTLAGGPAAVYLPAGTMEFSDFLYPGSKIYGIYDQIQANLVGAGIGKTVLRMKPGSSTAASRVPAQSTGQPVQIALLAGGAQTRLWQDFEVQATEQGHIYDGIRVNQPSGPVTLRRVKVTGIQGTATGPPGETFYINLWHAVPGSLIDQCECDGRRFDTGAKMGSSLFAFNSCNGVEIRDSSAHHNLMGFGVASWLTTDILYTRCNFSDTGSTGFHHENCFGKITLDHCTAMRNGNGFHASANNSTNYGGSAIWNIIDPIFDGPKFKVQWYAGAYGNTQSQKASDIHLFVGGVERPDLLYVGS